MAVFLCRRGPIFPGRLQPSIVGTRELNFRVRDGNGCTLAVIPTYCLCNFDVTNVKLVPHPMKNRRFFIDKEQQRSGQGFADSVGEPGKAQLVALCGAPGKPQAFWGEGGAADRATLLHVRAKAS